MRSIESLEEEIKHLNGLVAVTKWLAIIFLVLAIAGGIDNSSLTIFFLILISSIFIAGIWNGYEARKKRIEEEIEEREFD